MPEPQNPREEHVANSPVRLIPADKGQAEPTTGMGLCLSGGGYRAMLFHLGALIRLNELGSLQRLTRISSVSGGSITAGVLALHWKDLAFVDGVATKFDLVLKPLLELAGTTIDLWAVAKGKLLPGTVSHFVAEAYKKHLYGDATLQELPDAPRFVFNATNVQSMVLWRFSKPYMADYRVGMVRSPRVPLAVAVAASSSFPPVLSPMDLKLDQPCEDMEGTDLHRPPFTTKVVLTDGGVYDNLGLETVWKQDRTVLVSDGGGGYGAEEEPWHEWAMHALRINSIIDNQVRSLRKRQVIEGFKSGTRNGTYWGIRSHIADYKVEAPLPAPEELTLKLANTPTRLASMPEDLRDQIINWGYAICDAAMRKHVIVSAVPPKFPRPHPLG